MTEGGGGPCKIRFRQGLLSSMEIPDHWQPYLIPKCHRLQSVWSIASQPEGKRKRTGLEREPEENCKSRGPSNEEGSASRKVLAQREGGPKPPVCAPPLPAPGQPRVGMSLHSRPHTANDRSSHTTTLLLRGVPCPRHSSAIGQSEVLAQRQGLVNTEFAARYKRILLAHLV